MLKTSRAILPAVLAGLTAFAGLTAAVADYCPPASPQSAGMRDIMLAYVGPSDWKRADFLPYVAYLERSAGGRPRDWFYDAWLFLMFGGAPSGKAYYDGSASAADWHYYVDLLFARGQNFAALDACIEDVGRRLGDPDRVCPIIVMIPYLDRGNRDFGDVDGDGVPDRADDDAGRVRACSWLADAVAQRWQATHYRHLRLWGFYWMMEGCEAHDYAAARATADHLRGAGFGFHWIPWFMAPGHERWRDLGFDFVVMQPNYAFTPPPAGALIPDEDRLTRCAEECRRCDLGVEMELDFGVDANLAKQLNLRLYLNHGTDDLDGYMRGAVRAYYQATSFIASLYRSDLPEANRLYDDLYRFHKGTYRRRPVSMCEGAPATVNGRREPRLTDGLWTVREGQEGRAAVARAPVEAEVDLGAAQVVGDVRVRFAAQAGGPVAPESVEVWTSADGRAFEMAAEDAGPALYPKAGWARAFSVLTFPPRLARKVRVRAVAAPGASVAIEEIVIYPVRHLLFGARCGVEGRTAAPSAEAARWARAALTDGRLARGPDDQTAGVAFAGPDGRGRITAAPGQEERLDAALAHVWWPTRATPPRARVIARAGGEAPFTGLWTAARGDGEAWIEMVVPGVRAASLAVEVQGARALWDELQARPTPNLAFGKPYTVSPPFPARYLDRGGVQLTDGLLCDTSFGDGRNVGWWLQSPTITLDLGAETVVDAVRAQAEGGGYAGIVYPSAARVWVSADGEDWRSVARGEPKRTVTLSETLGGQSHELAWLALTFAPVRARYVRVQYTGVAWMMLGEVEVLSGGRNVALGRPYHTAPQPTSEGKYADDGVRLTDGAVSRPSDGWTRAVGWIGGEPEVVVDLLRPGRIGIVRVHAIGGGAGSVLFPKWLRVATSQDGATWSDEVEVATALTDKGDEIAVGWIEAQLSPRQARYVRVRLERRIWAMVDEVQVLAPR